MLENCHLCKGDFLTEADPYIVRPTPHGVKLYCSCMIVGHDQLSGIEKLQAENKKLREALEDFVLESDHTPSCNYSERFGFQEDCRCMDRIYYNRDAVMLRARKALKEVNEV